MTDDERLLSTMANAIGYEMFRHDRPVTVRDDGVEQVEVTDEERGRCLAAAARVAQQLDELGYVL